MFSKRNIFSLILLIIFTLFIIGGCTKLSGYAVAPTKNMNKELELEKLSDLELDQMIKDRAKSKGGLLSKLGIYKSDLYEKALLEKNNRLEKSLKKNLLMIQKEDGGNIIINLGDSLNPDQQNEIYDMLSGVVGRLESFDAINKGGSSEEKSGSDKKSKKKKCCTCGSCPTIF